ncbi:MAG: MFS transporter [Pseudomonadales bacterium]|nr:MFS transporter [Pseudomonadales bacterium]MBO7005653.1 MFS transporter [Pseudomonadales bacterium]
MNLPWYYGWNIVAVSLVFQAILFGSVFFSYTLWVGEWLEDGRLGVTLTMVMVPITILNLAQSLMAPFAGYAMDRYSIRSLICIGASSAGIGFLLISQVSTFWQIIVIYGTLMMVGVLLAGPLAAQTLAAKWFNKNRGLALGLSTTGTSIGGVVMAPLVTLLYQEHGWRDAHGMLGLVFIVVIVPLVWMLIRNSPLDLGIEPEPERLAHAQEEIPSHFWTANKILRDRVFWIIVLSFLPLVTVFGSVQQHLRPYAADLGVGSLETAYLISIFASVMIGGKIFFGMMADRFDHGALFLIALAACAIVVGGLLRSPDYSMLIFLAGLLGFSVGGFLPLLGAMVARHFGVGSFGSVLGLIGPFLAINAFGPIAYGYLYEVNGSYQIAFLISLALLVPGALTIVFLRDRI